MTDIDSLLAYIRRTNPEMTKEHLIEELSKSRYSAIALIMVCENNRKSACVSE